MKNIYLCGFMGCGKTTVADALAKQRGLPCYDIDALIVKQQGMTIPQMFERGEAFFRQAETAALRATGSVPGIYATGGGILTQEENGRLLNQMGILVFLDTPFSLCYQRIRGDENRPNAVSRTQKELQALYEQRLPHYQKWSVLSVSGEGAPQQIAKTILEKISVLDPSWSQNQ